MLADRNLSVRQLAMLLLLVGSKTTESFPLSKGRVPHLQVAGQRLVNKSFIWQRLFVCPDQLCDVTRITNSISGTTHEITPIDALAYAAVAWVLTALGSGVLLAAALVTAAKPEVRDPELLKKMIESSDDLPTLDVWLKGDLRRVAAGAISNHAEMHYFGGHSRLGFADSSKHTSQTGAFISEAPNDINTAGSFSDDETSSSAHSLDETQSTCLRELQVEKAPLENLLSTAVVESNWTVEGVDSSLAQPTPTSEEGATMDSSAADEVPFVVPNDQKLLRLYQQQPTNGSIQQLGHSSPYKADKQMASMERVDPVKKHVTKKNQDNLRLIVTLQDAGSHIVWDTSVRNANQRTNAPKDNRASSNAATEKPTFDADETKQECDEVLATGLANNDGEDELGTQPSADNVEVPNLTIGDGVRNGVGSKEVVAVALAPIGDEQSASTVNPLQEQLVDATHGRTVSTPNMVQERPASGEFLGSASRRKTRSDGVSDKIQKHLQELAIQQTRELLTRKFDQAPLRARQGSNVLFATPPSIVRGIAGETTKTAILTSVRENIPSFRAPSMLIRQKTQEASQIVLRNKQREMPETTPIVLRSRHQEGGFARAKLDGVTKPKLVGFTRPKQLDLQCIKANSSLVLGGWGRYGERHRKRAIKSFSLLALAWIVQRVVGLFLRARQF